MHKAPTKRQREALLAIHNLTTKNGVAPTIRELCTALDVSSDQTVIEMLARLEKAGFIIRDRKQARSTFITTAAKDALGMIASDTATGGTDQTPLELDDQEQKIFEKISEVDVSMGRMYKGALSVLRTTGNEDRIAQSAHSMREVIDHLSNKGTAFMPKQVKDQIKNDRSTRRTVHGLRFYFDPQARLETVGDPYKHLYDQYQTELNAIAHHENTRITEVEYRALLRQMGYFLIRYVFPSQVEIYKLLDEIIKKGSTEVDADDLQMLIKRNTEAYRYFYKNVDARWISFLIKNAFLLPDWEVGEYLARIAPEAPKEVLNVFLTVEIPKDAWQVKASFAVVASKLPAELASQTVEKIIREDWVKDTRASMVLYRLQDLLKNLLPGEQYEAALKLTDTLLDIFPQEYGSYGSLRTNAYISEYEYSQIIELILTLPPEHLSPFLKLLCEKLIKTISAVHAKEDGQDYSYIWRSAIEQHEQNHSYDRIEDALISGVRDALEKRIQWLIKESKDVDAKKELQSVTTHAPMYSILLRMRLHMYRTFPALFKDEVVEAITNPPTKSSEWHEHSLLIHAAYKNAGTETKKKYLSVIDTYDKSLDEYADSWRVRLISLVQDSLTPTQKKKYADLLTKGAGLDQPFFTSYMSSGYVGPQSPKNESDFENKTPAEVLDMLKTWTPPGDQFFGPTRSGLGMTFQKIVANEAPKYSNEADIFLDESLRSVYIYHFLSGLNESLKNKVGLNWNAILNLITGIIARARAGKLLVVENEEEDRLDADWREVMKETSRLLTRGLDTNAISLKDRNRVWDAITYLAEHPDPTPEYEEKYGGDNSDPYTMSINTARGDAFHTIFAFIFWYNREEKNRDEKWSITIPDEVKALLELHLDPAHDSSLAVRSVYGRFFPWLLSYGKKWTENLVPKIFPIDNIGLRYAAWETYLSNMIFEESYNLLRPLYELAVSDITTGGKVPKRRYWVDAVERLAEHAMIAYAFDVEDSKDPFSVSFFKTASGKCRGMAVSLGGRAFVSKDNVAHGEKMPKLTTLQKFWEWRLKESDAPSELREFGWWTKEGKFNNKWMLEQLLKTVEKTKGDVNGEFIVMHSLDTLASEYPLLCAKILKLIFASTSRRDRYVFLHVAELRSALIKILKTDTEEAKKVAHQTIDYLLKLGVEDMKNLEDLAI